LNVWRGELGEETKKYIVDESRNTDVFVYKNIMVILGINVMVN